MTGPGIDEVAVVLVTHNGAAHLTEQLQSIVNQSVTPAAVIWVDDSSTDESADLVRSILGASDISLIEIPRAQPARDRFTRIARNFEVALRFAEESGFEYLALCDQDDYWSPHRLEHQLQRISESGAEMTAANGRLVDTAGTATGETLRDRFPVIDGWADAAQADRLRSVLRQPMATGAASMVSRDLLAAALPIPPHWLHDRWLSVVAAARGALDCDDTIVIDYRLYPEQAVGLTGKTGLMGFSRLIETLRRPGVNARKLWDLCVRVHGVSANDLSAQLTPVSVARSYLSTRSTLSTGWLTGRPF